MNDENDIPLHPSADEVVEARIVAWVLGEASAFEIAELERLCAEKPELAAFHQRMLALQGLLGEAVGHESGDEWKLPEAKAKTIHEAFGEVPSEAVVEKKKRPLWKSPQPWIGVAACLAVSTVVWRYNEEQYDGSYGALGTGGSGAEDVPLPAVRGMMSAEKPSSSLRRAIGLQEKKVEESRKKLSNIVREKGIVYTGKESIFRTADPQVDSSVASAPSGGANGGMRSGDAEITRNNIDAILNNPERPASPAAPAPVTAAPADPAIAAQPRAARTRTIPPEKPVSEFKSREADSGSSSELTKHEVARRQGAVADADRLLLEGREAYAKGDYEKAVDLYAKSKKSLPDAPNLAERRAEYNLHLSDASVALAQQYRKVGKYNEARGLLEGVLAPDLDPNNASAKRELSFLDDPIRTNPALTDEHTKNLDPVRRSLYMAEGNYNLGKYDDAKKDYEAALRADPYNAAARRGLERLATAKSDYYRAAYDHTRAELLMEVDKAWELDVPKVEKQMDEIDLFAKTAAPDGASGFRAEVKSSYEVPGQRFSMNLNGNRGVGEGMGRSMADNLNNLGELENGLKPEELTIDGFAYQVQDEGTKLKPAEGIASLTGLFSDGNDMITAGKDTSAPEDAISELAAKPAQELLAPTDGISPASDQPEPAEMNPYVGAAAPAEKAIDLNEIATAEEAFSTFSLNVSDVSFQLALASLEKSESPDPASIKVEQFYNAVDYGDPAPSGDPIATKIEQSAHPVIPGRNLVRLGVKTASAGRSAAQPLNLTLLIDQSGSMVRDDRRAALEKALTDLSTLLTEKDRVSVIGFSRTPSLLADGIAGNQLGAVTGMMNREAAESGTNLEEALSLAQQIALRQASHEAGNRIVLFTDGAANLGDADPARLAEKVRTLRQEGVAFDVAGIGADGLNDKLLAELARNGDGRYLLAAGNIAAQLAGAFRPAAEDVKVQVRFNPERVSRYKLIGFEEDRLKKEDFRNDAVDAAELAAEEAAVALYQVELIPDGKGEIGEMSVRFRDAASGEMVERSWTIAHDANTPVFDKATPSMQLAGLSMLAGEKLKGGPMAPMIDFRKYNGGIASVRQYYANSSKVADMLRLIGLLAR